MITKSSGTILVGNRRPEGRSARTALRKSSGTRSSLGLTLLVTLTSPWTYAQTHNEALFQQIEQVHHLTPDQMRKLRAIFAGSRIIGQGNPAITQHPVTPEQCEAKLQQQGVNYANARFERICGAKYMAPLYNPRTQKPEDATACIDQFEFPDIPCAYPVVWVQAREAAEICAAEGKRLCDANEWEDACQGDIEPLETAYRFDLAAKVPPEEGIHAMRAAHNRADANNKRWSYGPTYQRGICATGSFKTAGCNGGDWYHCGSNTYPTGDFPACHSPLEVYDLNGNAAEHMNLPLNPSEMSSRGSITLGYTEMKGSWFIFDTYRAHDDWCRWRAPFWHGTRVMDAHSHANYHLSFRCCNSIGKSAAASPTTNSTATVGGDAISAAQVTRREPAAARRQLQSLGLLPSGP